MRSNTSDTSHAKKWDKELEDLMKELVKGSQGLTIQSAKELDRRHVDYFRGDKFVKWVNTNVAACRELAPSHMPTEGESTRYAQVLGQRLIDNGFICLAQAIHTDAAEQQKASKWPKRLGIARKQEFDEKGFYVIVHEGDNTWSHIILTLIVVAVLIVVMWPAWPLRAKLAIWFVALSLCSLLWIFILIRLVVFVLFWFFGVDFWIMPEFFNDNIPFLECFKPYSWEHRGDTWFMVFSRIACFFFMTAGVWQLGQTHSISDVYVYQYQLAIDIHEWGTKFITEQAADPRSMRLTVEQLEEMGRQEEKQESDADGEDADRDDADGAKAPTQQPVPYPSADDVKCLDECGFSSYGALKEECMDDCGCMTELFASKCVSSCTGPFRRDLAEMRDDACASREADGDDEL